MDNASKKQFYITLSIAIYGAVLGTIGTVFPVWTYFHPHSPKLDFRLIKQTEDSHLHIAVTNSGNAHSFVDRIELCGLNEFVLQNISARKELYPKKEDDFWKIDMLIGFHSSTEWIARCDMDKAQHPAIISGSRLVSPDSTTELEFDAVKGIKLSSTVGTGVSHGKGLCSITLYANDYVVSQAFLCEAS